MKVTKTLKTLNETFIRKHDIGHELFLLFLLLFIVVLMSILSDRFLTTFNLLEMSRNYVEIGLLALPITFIIISGGIDLSVGSIVGISAIILGIVFDATGLMWLAIVCCMATAILCGLFNGFLIGKARIMPLVATLATLYFYRGIALGLSEARSYAGFPIGFRFLGLGNIGAFPVQLIIFALLAIVFMLILNRMDIGRKIRAIGYNESAALYTNVNARQVKYFLYALSGLMAGLVALIFVSRITVAKANAGEGYELDAITIAVLGGADIRGGRGTILGTVLAMLTIGVLRNGLTLIRVPSEIQNVLIGAILILTILIKELSNTFKHRTKKMFPTQGGGD